MPFIITELIGGLGNQIFILASIYALAKRYNTKFVYINTQSHITTNTGFTIPNYTDSVLSDFLSCDICTTLNSISYTSELTMTIHQFHDFTLPDTIDIHNTLIHIKGLPMYYPIIQSSLSSISELFYKTKNKYFPNPDKELSIRKIGVMFRTFIQENIPECAIIDQYYEKAIEYMINKYNELYVIELHVYSDSEGVTSNIIQPILTKLNKNIQCKEYVGKRDNKTDVEHFFQMFDLDDYILCNSTYHYWPALLSTYSEDKIITYSNQQKGGGGDIRGVGWVTYIVDPNWIQL